MKNIGDALSGLTSVWQKQDHRTVIRVTFKIHNFGSANMKDLFLVYNLGSPIKFKRIKSLARKLLVLYWFFHQNFKGLEITKTNGFLILSKIFIKKTRILPWFLQNSNNHITLLRIVTIHNRLIELSLKSWCHWALVWPSNPCFILNSSVVVKWGKLGTVSWNRVSVQKVERMLFWQGSI